MKHFRTSILFLILALVFCCSKQTPQGNVYPLLQDVADADINWDARWIDLGTPGAHAVLVSGWYKDRQYPDGLTTVITAVNKAVLHLHILNPGPRTLKLRCRAAEPDRPGFGLLVNGERVGRQKLSSNFKDYDFSVPANLLYAGKNWITVVGQGVEIDSIQISSPGENPLQQADRIISPGVRLQTTTAEKGSQKRLLGSLPSSVGLYCRIPKNSVLKVDFGLPAETAKRGDAARFSIFLDQDGKPRRELATKTVERGFFGGSSGTFVIPLNDYSNQIVRLVLQADEKPYSPSVSSIYWTTPELILPHDQTPDSADDSQPTIQQAAFQPRPLNVIIYTIDALRADHLQSYGYAKDNSPRILEFSRDAALFENAYSNTCWTRASVATILTGLYPSSHLTEDRLDTFPDFADSIQKEMKAAGFTTLGVTTNGNISADFNFKRDFDEYIHLRENGQTLEIHKQSDELFQTLKKVLDNHSKAPFFLYIHATDPHEPHTAEQPFLQVPPQCNVHDSKIRRPVNGGEDAVYKPQEVECVRAVYDSEIRQSDFYFGKFLDRLKELGLYDRSVIILTADHGESLFEHGFWGHGLSLFQSEIHVPLIIHFPEGKFAGARIRQPARHIDLFPTILQSVSLKIPEHIAGRSLLPALQKPDSDIPVFAELRLDQRLRKMVIWQNAKVIENERPGPNPFLYFDLKQDPGEKENNYSLHPVLFGYLRTVLNGWSRVQEQARNVSKKGPQAVIDPEMEETLKALGYLK